MIVHKQALIHHEPHWIKRVFCLAPPVRILRPDALILRPALIIIYMAALSALETNIVPVMVGRDT